MSESKKITNSEALSYWGPGGYPALVDMANARIEALETALTAERRGHQETIRVLRAREDQLNQEQALRKRAEHDLAHAINHSKGLVAEMVTERCKHQQTQAMLDSVRADRNSLLDADRARREATQKEHDRLRAVKDNLAMAEGERDAARAIIRAQDKEIAELGAGLLSRQSAIEILGRAIGKVFPHFRATGDAPAHSESIGRQLVNAVEALRADRDRATRAHLADHADLTRLRRAAHETLKDGEALRSAFTAADVEVNGGRASRNSKHGVFSSFTPETQLKWHRTAEILRERIHGPATARTFVGVDLAPSPDATMFSAMYYAGIEMRILAQMNALATPVESSEITKLKREIERLWRLVKTLVEAPS